jgi:hypothetical protein
LPACPGEVADCLRISDIRYEARWAHAELLAARGDEKTRQAVAAGALRSAQDSGYLVLVPRLRELAGL